MQAFCPDEGWEIAFALLIQISLLSGTVWQRRLFAHIKKKYSRSLTINAMQTETETEAESEAGADASSST